MVAKAAATPNTTNEPLTPSIASGHSTIVTARVSITTPLTIFNASCTEPSLLQMGGRVRFTPISAAEFDDLTAQQKASR